MAATPVVSVAHESGVASWGTFAGDVPQTCRTLLTDVGSGLMYKVCSTSGCPHLVSSGSLCDECRKAKDKRRTRGRNPYTSKAHRLARARVLARIRGASVPATGRTDAEGTMAYAVPPAP